MEVDMRFRGLGLAAGLCVAAVGAQAQGIKVGDFGIIADAPYYVAIEKGYFAAEKLQVTLEPFGSAADATVAISTNRLQVMGGGPSAGLFNAFARDWPVRIVMARTRDTPGYSSNTLII